MPRTIYTFTIMMVLFASCAPPSVVTIYRDRDNNTKHIHAVLVAAVIAGEDTALKARLENYFSGELKKLGFHAVPASSAFGDKGLASLGQEETLMKLCNYGFDAVLTVALVDGKKEKYRTAPSGNISTAAFYLDRIWNYEKIQSEDASQPFWECILFDLFTLRPLSAVQTKFTDADQAGAVGHELAKRVISRMKITSQYKSII